MPNRVRVLMVPDADRAELERRARSKGAPARVVERARIVLLAADGLTGAQIAERAGCTEPTGKAAGINGSPVCLYSRFVSASPRR
jgi:Homeodomain-like domain